MSMYVSKKRKKNQKNYLAKMLVPISLSNAINLAYSSRIENRKDLGVKKMKPDTCNLVAIAT